MSASASTEFDPKENSARLDRMLAETGKLLEETRKFVAESHKLDAEARKLETDRRKTDRDRMLAPWAIVITAMAAGAAIVGATVALVKVLGP